MYIPPIRYGIIDLLQFNKDLEGDVQFSAEAGVFSVPIRCTIKKCDVREHLNFCSSYRQYIFHNADVLFLLFYLYIFKYKPVLIIYLFIYFLLYFLQLAGS